MQPVFSTSKKEKGDTVKSHLLRTSLLAAFLTLCMPFFLQTEAHAKIPLFIINTGDVIYPVADIPVITSYSIHYTKLYEGISATG